MRQKPEMSSTGSLPVTSEDLLLVYPNYQRKKYIIMASRSVGRVVLSFGMAHIAIKLYKLASDDEKVHFSNFNPATKNPLGNRQYDKGTDETVTIAQADILKGYEYAKGQFVYFTEAEVANMQAAKKDSLEIAEFVPVSEINPLRIEKTYYTAPDKGMDKGYRFLYELLKVHGKAAIGTYVARGKEHLVAIQAYQHGLVMCQLFYDTEVRAFDNQCANVPVSPIEMAMGKVLMDTLSKPTFDSSKYSDRFIDKVNAAVEFKLVNPDTTITETSSPVTTGGMADTLRASLLSMGIPESEIDAMISDALVPDAEPIVTAPAKVRKTRTKKAS